MKLPMTIGVLISSLVCFLGCQPGITSGGKQGVAPKTLKITEKDNGAEAVASPGDIVELKLGGQGGTGFSWEIAKNDPALLEPKGKPAIERVEDAKPGANELTVFRFEVKGKGKAELEAVYRRPFEKDKAPEKTFKWTVRIGDKEKSEK